MKLVGSFLILWSAGICFLLHRRESRVPILLGQALLADLAVLKSRVCTACMPLPQILESELSAGIAAQYLWRPLRLRLQGGDGACLEACWRLAAAQLPPPMDRMLFPLGPMLSRGEAYLGCVIDETREELTGFLRAERQRRAAADRITAALCLSGASLVILVLI